MGRNRLVPKYVIVWDFPLQKKKVGIKLLGRWYSLTVTTGVVKEERSEKIQDFPVVTKHSAGIMSKTNAGIKPQNYNYVLVLDFEATCVKDELIKPQVMKRCLKCFS